MAARAHAYRDTGALDPERVIAEHSNLVRRIAWHVHARMSVAVEIEDLMQIGLMALVEAARGYEDRGHAFSTYASMRVRGAMIDQLRRDARVGRGGMAKRREIAHVRQRLENELFRQATDAEMAAAMDMSLIEYHRALIESTAIAHATIEDGEAEHEAWFADASESAEDAIAREELRTGLAEAIGRLDGRHAMVLQLYFVEDMNLHEIGATLGVTAARVCQLKRAALEALREAMAAHA